MRARRPWKALPLVLLALVLLPTGGRAQSVPWREPVRGSWVRTGPALRGDVVLAGAGVASEIVVGATEPSNVRQAAEFLAGDIEKISGSRPALVQRPTSGRTSIRLVTLGNGKLPGIVDAGALRGQWEAYRIATDGDIVWLVGSNPRGTAFAAYTLSERLGIDPLYLWTGYVPEHRDPLVLRATRFVQGPPTFRFRGFFHDDEDILPRPFDERGYPLQTGDVPLDWYRRFFETALRLRMNMVAPYTRVHRRVEVQKLASDWGLYYTSHHYDILVSNPFGLERFNLAAERGVKPEWNWFTNREGMLKFWRGGVLENRDIDVIWPVGMRGTSDRAYTFPPGTTDEQKAQAFHDAIRAQVAMVKELLPKDKAPLFHFTMYTEMLDQYRKNPQLFDVPDDVIIVWPDDNDGHMRGLPAELGRWKHGVYYHLAYLGGNLSKQVTHTVAPATVAEEFGKIVKAGATEFMLVNVSELREYVMGARMLADITWDAPAALAAPDPAARYTEWWSREYFGASAPAADSAYSAYFSLLDRPDRLWFAADAVDALLDRLHRRLAGNAPPPASTDTLAQLRARALELKRALSLVDRAAARMDPAQRGFFQEDVGLGLLVDARQTEAALDLADAVAAPDSATMWRAAQAALAPLEQLEVELLREEYPPFDRWYGETWIRSRFSRNNPHRSYENVRAFLAARGKEGVAAQERRRVAPPTPLDSLARGALRWAAQQARRTAEAHDPAQGFPRNTQPDGSWQMVGARDWTAGFFPGLLWQLYDYTRDPYFRAKAEAWTAPMEQVKTLRTTHDLGFMLFSSFGQGWRLTGNEHYRDVLLEGSRSLASRFNATVGAIKSWNNRRWQFPVIIDNMMNLELLFWAARHGGDPSWKQLATTHALTTLREHVRPDGSTFHLVDFDTATGKAIAHVTVQGWADSSMWARGQAWAIYGFTVAYRETRDPRFLRTAERAADRFLAELPPDRVPYWDLRQPDIPNTERDASAGAIAASGLLELARYAGADGARYRTEAERILRSLATDYTSQGTGAASVLLHSVGSRPAGSQVDAGIIYADYYFVEALLRYLHQGEAGGRAASTGARP